MTRRSGVILLLMFLIYAKSFSQGQPPEPPKREVRAVWIATVGGLDWPQTQNTDEQQRILLGMIVKLKEAKFNTIFFQVRGRGDAFYNSHYEPWSQQLTGTLGKNPGWDPLQFVVTEAHARGMEVHAWFNTFLVKTGKTRPAESSPRHLILQHPEWFHQIDGDWWLDPGLPAVREYLLNVGMDIVRQYDIDGFHFDFMRYPGKSFGDESAFRQFGNKKISREDWRRENINKFVRAFYDSATALKPMLKIGSAPIGIYTNVGKSGGWQAYYDLYQDSRGWLREQKQDYLAPQVYWSLGDRPGNPDFAALTRDWAEHSFGRHIYPGIGAYKPEVHQQLPNLIDSTRATEAEGNAFFRYENISDAFSLGGRYRFPADIPPMPWKDSIPPNPPANLIVNNVNDGIFSLDWRVPQPASDGDGAKYFNVYRSTRTPVNINDPKNLFLITPDARISVADTIKHPLSARYYYAVTALDKGNNESLPTSEQGAVISEVVELSKHFMLKFSLNGNYTSPVSSVVYVPYEIPERSPVLIKILDGMNRDVADIVDAVQMPGRYVASANLGKLKEGTYSCLFVAGNYTEKKTFVVNK